MLSPLRAISVAFLLAFAALPASADTGVLLLAHGGRAEWNARVTELAAQVDRQMPTETAFGMATRAAMQASIDRLVARGVTEIVAVPLFVSSWSSVITSTEYLLGLRAQAPTALAHHAKMDHGQHDAHAADGTAPVKSPVPVRMTPALNDHAIVADILASRARAMSRDPQEEAVVIVAHGPNEEDDNRRWLADMATLARRVAALETFAVVDYLTLRDDAPRQVRDRATAELRALVERRTREGRRVLVVPLLISFGGIERGLYERLQGLSYTMADAALMPDDRLVGWVLAMARGGRP